MKSGLFLGLILLLTAVALTAETVPLAPILARQGLKLGGGTYGSRYTLTKGPNSVHLGPGLTMAIINGKSVSLDEAPEFRGGELHVPDNFERLLTQQLLAQRTQYWQTITLDPGHGGKDPGAISPATGLQEKDVVLDVSKKVRAALQQEGVKVHITRDKDIFIPLEARALVANRTQSNLFVSIHADACAVASVSGVEVFFADDWPDSNISTTTRAHFLAGQMDLNDFVTGRGKMRYSRQQEVFFFKLMLEQANIESRLLADEVVNAMARGLDTDNRGIKTKNLRVIRRSACPPILIECGFLTNRWEARRLATPDYRTKVARKITDGLLAYLRRRVKAK